jgi:hypothetical protein
MATITLPAGCVCIPMQAKPITLCSEQVLRKKLNDVLKENRLTMMSLPSIDKTILKLINKSGCWIAGGAALAIYTGAISFIKDWDIFGPINYLDAFEREIRKEGFVDKNETKLSKTFVKSNVFVQLVQFIHPQSVEEIFGSFDFHVCCFAIENEDLCFTLQAVDDLHNKILNVNSIHHIGLTISRIARYGAKGFTPSLECVKKLIEYCHSVDPNNLNKECGY